MLLYYHPTDVFQFFVFELIFIFKLQYIKFIKHLWTSRFYGPPFAFPGDDGDAEEALREAKERLAERLQARLLCLPFFCAL